MTKAWIEKIHEATEVLDYTANLLLKSAVAFQQTGNRLMYDTLKFRASEIKNAILTIDKACSEKLGWDLKNAQSQSGLMLEACLAGVQVANKEKATIIIEVEGGVVQDVKNVPPGIVVEVRDFDCDEEASEDNEVEILDGEECWVDHYTGD